MKLGPDISESIELRFSNLARKMNASGEHIISLGLGEPDFPTPDPIIEAAAQALRDGETRYSHPLGIADLRDLIAAKLQSENHVSAAPEQIVVTPGAKMALSLTLCALLETGNEVINLSPCYPSYVPQIKIAEPSVQIRTLDLSRDAFSIDFDSLAKQLGSNTKAILINFPNNPTGQMLTGSDIEALADILANHDCWLISDEIYEKLNFSGLRHISPAAHEKLAPRTVTINGFSKAYSMTGWRIGYLHVPDPDLLILISKLQQHLNTNTAAFIQRAACKSFSLPDDFLDDYNARLAANHGTLLRMVAQNERLSLVESRGGLFEFLDISRTGMRSDEFAAELLRSSSVAATPGIVFGKHWDDHLRISLAIDSTGFATGIERLDEFVRCR